jgi:glycosyltransferase involved in cell wall biosynthesis
MRDAPRVLAMDTPLPPVLEDVVDVADVADVTDVTASGRPLRVAVVTETWPPEVNGVAMSLARIVSGLRSRDHSVQLVRPRQRADDRGAAETDPEAVLTRGLPIPRYPGLRLGVPQRRALIRLWSARRPDIVHLATEGPLGWSALRAALHLGLPISSDFRTNFHAYSGHYGAGWLQRPIAAYLRRFHNRTALTMVPTESLRRELAGWGYRNLAVVARGVDTARFHPGRRSVALRTSWGAPSPRTLVVACVGRLAPEKNLATLLDAFDAIARTTPRARLVLVGDGPMRAALQARRPDAVFAGQRGGEDLAAHYASADLFLFPSLTETFGNVTAEAMASGLPVVAFDYAAAAQLIRDGDSGRLVRHADNAAFVALAADLASDAPRRLRMGIRARESVAALGWTDVVGRFETLIRQTAARGGAG